MSHFTLSELQTITAGRLRSDGGVSDGVLDAEWRPLPGRVVTDSRQVQPGDLFWALPGTLHDGADFVPEAFRHGAVGAVTHSNRVQPAAGRWVLQVRDSLEALHALAAWHRSASRARVVAVTGSVGKTTTRQLIDCVLGTRFDGLASPHNFNNHVGLPLSLVQLNTDHDYAVFELGASSTGEIDLLAGLCQPHVGVITAIGEAHLGGFGCATSIAQAKAELLAHLPADGLAVLPGDDPWRSFLASRTKAQVILVGRGSDCHLAASEVQCHGGLLRLRIDGTRLTVPLRGRHFVTAVTAAVAVGKIFGVSLADMADALRHFQPPAMRCQVTELQGATIINDSYNASPSAMRAALELLRDFDAPGRRFVVCGDMKELGPQSAQYHRQLGDQVVTICGADYLVACGDYAEDVVGAARRAGMSPHRTLVCRQPQDAAAHLLAQLEPGDVLLVKGSRAMSMEHLIDQLECDYGRAAA